MTDALVPDSFDEFRSVKFWDGFFKERGQRPFEWYGDWRQLKPFLTRDCKPGKDVLVVGCGNSELSADLYDSGCQDITNVDFSKLVIASMMRRNLRQRPRMKWKVGDMTDLQFKEESFQVVLDKGGLDALMGEESPESTESGQKLLTGVSHVLSPGGVYLCITLAQSQVLKLLLDHFKHGWLLELHPVPPSLDMARSPLQPVFLRAKKLTPGQKIEDSNVCSIARSPKAPNAEQLEEICQILENAASSVLEEVQGSSAAPQSRDCEFDELHPGTRKTFGLPYCPEKPVGALQARFTAVVLDVAGRVADAAIQSCCVFLVPQGRESEWLFASEEGQWQVAGQCRCKRIILILLGRKHQFSAAASVQAELSPLVEPLAPKDVRWVRGAIPIMTTQAGVGRRRVVAEIQSSISGKVVVEDVAVEADPKPGFARRMIFVDSSNLIQSEARLISSASNSLPEPPSSRKKSLKNKSSGATAFPQLELDHSVLAMDYHKHIVGGILARSCSIAGQSGTETSGLVIGLGGGGLPVFLSRYLGIQTDVVELDKEVASLASQYFGCTSGLRLQVEVGDGLQALDKREPGTLDALIVDAGASDASLAISCPPAPFLQTNFLKKAACTLRLQGIFVVNCVTRSQAAFKTAFESIQAVFPETRFSELEDDVNRVIFASQTNVFEHWSKSLSSQELEHSCIAQLGTESKQLLLDELSNLSLQATT